MKADFWRTLPGIIAFVIGCGFLSMALTAWRRSLIALCRWIHLSCFPPASRDNVVDIAARRRQLDFTVRQPESVDLRILRQVQRGRDYSQKGFGS